jgi:hypothetical protein
MVYAWHVGLSLTGGTNWDMGRGMGRVYAGSLVVRALGQ